MRNISVSYLLEKTKIVLLILQEFEIDPTWFEERGGSDRSILLYDNGAGGREREVEGNRVLVFGMEQHLMYLCQSNIWLGIYKLKCFEKNQKKNIWLVRIMQKTKISIYIH